MSDLNALLGQIEACLEATDPDAALLVLAARPLVVPSPHMLRDAPPIMGLAAWLIAQAMLRLGRPEQVAPLLDRFSDALAPSIQQRGEGSWRVLVPFRFLFIPLIDAELALGNQERAITRLNELRDGRRHARPSFADEDVTRLTGHTRMHDSPPAVIDPAWMLDRHEKARRLGALDPGLEKVRTFHAGLVESALLAGEPRRAMTLIDDELDGYMIGSVLDLSHFEFNAICVLATLGEFDRALATARQLVRRGYRLAWRFDLEAAGKMSWTQEMRQNEWLAALARTPAYRRFLQDDLPGPLLGDDPADNPLCMVKDGVWGGKKAKRCAVSRRMIQPGDAVVRFRRLFNRASDGDLEMADRSAFETSPWQRAREEFEGNAIPARQLFPRRTTMDARIDHAPFIHAFAYDVARDPAALGIDRAVALIAEHGPPPIGYSWEKPGGADRWVPAFPERAGAQGHGDAVNLVWRLRKAGFGSALTKAAERLPPDLADKVFAMLGTFAEPELREAAARHFELPGLVETMAVAFKDRLTLADHAHLADFGSAHSRYRRGLGAAMRGYSLHLYSNYRPQPDWFLSGLEHYSSAGGSALLYFLIDHPEDDPVLQTVVERCWLPDKLGGSTVEYDNARPFYVRAALLHLARHDPDHLEAWLAPEVVGRWSGMAYDRETLRLMKQWSRSASKAKRGE